MSILDRNNVHMRGDKGDILLYAHGFGCSQHMWERITPAFAETNRQILFDYVGSGASDVTAFDVQRYSSLNGYARDLIDVCDALGLEGGVTLVGHSVSSSIGLLAAIERPGLFDRMIMIGPSLCFLNHAPDYIGGFEREDLHELMSLMNQNYIGWAQHLAPIAAGDGGTGAVTAELQRSFCSTDPVRMRTFAEATFFADYRAEAAKVAVPSLILQHRRDALAPVGVGEFVHKQLRNSRLQLLDVDGHCAHMSHPDLVVDAMRAFLETPIVRQ